MMRNIGIISKIRVFVSLAIVSPFQRIQMLMMHLYDFIDYSPVTIERIYQIVVINARKYRTNQYILFGVRLVYLLDLFHHLFC